MNCPNCDSPIAADQHFCRDCGAELSKSKRRADPRVLAFISVGLILAGVFIAMLGKLMGSKLVTFAGVFMMMAVALLSLLGAAIISGALRGPQKRTKAKTPTPVQLPAVDTTNKLPPMPAADHFPSVTEHTTRHLEAQERNSDVG